MPQLSSLLLRALLLSCAAHVSHAVAAEAVPLPFRDLFELPVGPGGLKPSATLLHAQGREVALRGFMVLQEVPVPGEFLLSPRPVMMTEHSDGAADDLPVSTVRVRLDASRREWIVPHVAGPIQLAGHLRYGRSERDDGRVFWLELQLDAAALSGPAPAP